MESENTEILTEENDLSKNEQDLSLKKPVSEDSNKYPEKSEAMPDQNESSENLIVQENISGGTGITKIRDSGSSKIEIFFSSFSCTNICHIWWFFKIEWNEDAPRLCKTSNVAKKSQQILKKKALVWHFYYPDFRYLTQSDIRYLFHHCRKYGW